MSISAMGVRSALRVAQDANAAKPGVVVSAVQPVAPGADPEGNPTSPASPFAELLERLTAWIPTESIAVFLAFSGFFGVFDNTTEEFALVGVVAVLTVLYAVQASRGAQVRRGQDFRLGAAVKTALIAVVAFLVWWIATPGTWLTADKDVGTYWVALALVLVVALMPSVAKLLKVDPLRS